MDELMNELKSTPQLVHVGFWEKLDIHSKEIIVERLEIIWIWNKLYGYIANKKIYNTMYSDFIDSQLQENLKESTEEKNKHFLYACCKTHLRPV